MNTATSKATSKDKVTDRIAALRHLMAEKSIDACIVPTGDPHMSEYISDHYKTREFITGFTGSAGTAVILANAAGNAGAGDAGLWTDSRYFLQAADELSESGITLYKQGLPGTITISDFLKQKLRPGSRVCFDGRLVSSSWASNLRKATASSEFEMVTDLDLVGEIWQDRPEIRFEPIVDYPLEYAGVSREEKIQIIRNDMSKADADVLILSGLSDIAWLLNLRGNDILCNPVFFSFVILTRSRVLLYADAKAFAMGAAARDTRGRTDENRSADDLLADDLLADDLLADGVELKPYDSFYDDLATINNLNDSENLIVMLDRKASSERIVKALPESVKIIDKYSPVMQRKAVKNPIEIDGIYSSHLKDGIAMCKFLYWLKKSIARDSAAAGEITEISAAEKLHDFRAGQELFKGDSFEAIVGYGPHGAIVHYAATPESNVVLEPRGFVLIDSGGQYLDGTTDVTRTIALGPLTEKEKTLFTTVLRGHINLARARFPKGLNGANIDYLAHEPLWEMGLDYGHGTGHGVGHYLNVHEDPNRIHWKASEAAPPMPPFEEGMLTSDEPGYYEEGEFGIRHESLLLCVSDSTSKNVELAEAGCDELTKADCSELTKPDYGEFLKFDEVTLVPFDLEAVLPERMQPDEIEYLNAYHEKVYKKISPHLNDDERDWLRQATAPIGR